MTIDWASLILTAARTDIDILVAMVVRDPWPFVGVVGLLILIAIIPRRLRRRYR